MLANYVSCDFVFTFYENNTAVYDTDPFQTFPMHHNYNVLILLSCSRQLYSLKSELSSKIYNSSDANVKYYLCSKIKKNKGALTHEI